MLAIVLIIIIFMSLVLVHEWGHFLMARRHGVTVLEFGIGFPPRLLSHVWRGTLYTLNLLPLGGFVRLKGEDGEDKEPGSFLVAPLGIQTRILLAGVTMNIILAFVILTALAWTSLPGIGSFEPGFLPRHYAQTPRVELTDVEAGSPAAKAGLQTYDAITQANGQAMATEDQLYNFTKANAGKTISITYVHKGATQTKAIKLRPPSTTTGYLGVGTQQIYRLHYGWWQGIVAAAWITAKLFVLTIWAVLQLIYHIPSLITGLFSKQVPAAAAAASGPVGIFFILKSLTSLGADYVLLFAANISIALAAFNVLPIPALDGGRWALLAVQRLGHKKMRSQTEALTHAIGFFLLLCLIGIITVYDVRRYF